MAHAAWCWCGDISRGARYLGSCLHVSLAFSSKSWDWPLFPAKPQIPTDHEFVVKLCSSVLCCSLWLLKQEEGCVKDRRWQRQMDTHMAVFGFFDFSKNHSALCINPAFADDQLWTPGYLPKLWNMSVPSSQTLPRPSTTACVHYSLQQGSMVSVGRHGCHTYRVLGKT